MKKILFLTLTLSAFLLVSCERDNYTEWKMMNAQWLETHRDSLANAGFTTSSSGLIYKIIEEGFGRKPNLNSYITASYTGKLVNGKMFDSGTVYGSKLSTYVVGWQEGIAKLKDGGRIILYIPYNLGYGTETSGQILPYSTLIFDVTLIRSDY